MSARLMGRVWELDLPHHKQAVLLRLAWHAHDDGTNARPGIEHLAWATGYSERNCKRILAELEADELIEAEDGKTGGRGRIPNYTLHLENGVKKGDKSDTKRVTSRAVKGDISDKKGDKSDIPYIDEPSIEQSEEPTERKPTKIYARVIEDCLALLDDLTGYPKDRQKNAEHLENQWARPRPSIDFREEVEKFCDHYAEQGFKRDQKPRARLSTWLNNAQSWAPKRKASACSEREKPSYEQEWETRFKAIVGGGP